MGPRPCSSDILGGTSSPPGPEPPALPLGLEWRVGSPQPAGSFAWSSPALASAKGPSESEVTTPVVVMPTGTRKPSLPVAGSGWPVVEREEEGLELCP